MNLEKTGSFWTGIGWWWPRRCISFYSRSLGEVIRGAGGPDCRSTNNSAPNEHQKLRPPELLAQIKSDLLPDLRGNAQAAIEARRLRVVTYRWHRTSVPVDRWQSPSQLWPILWGSKRTKLLLKGWRGVLKPVFRKPWHFGPSSCNFEVNTVKVTFG